MLSLLQKGHRIPRDVKHWLSTSGQLIITGVLTLLQFQTRSINKSKTGWKGSKKLPF